MSREREHSRLPIQDWVKAFTAFVIVVS